MKHEKIKKAAYLFSELSGVEDRYLVEALMPVKAARKPRLSKHWMLLAACLMLTLVVGISMLLPMRDLSGDDHFNGDGFTGNNNAPQDGAPSQSFAWRLDTLLEEKNGMVATRVEKDAFDFFTGECRVVWQYEGEAHYYMSRPLTENERKALYQSVEQGTRSPFSGNDEPNVRIWISEGDGTVWTPYLQYTDGNASAADFFDYHAEVIPSDDLVSCVSDLIFN